MARDHGNTAAPARPYTIPQWALAVLLASSAWGAVRPPGTKPEVPLVAEEVVFEEVDGVLAAEAEHCFRQTHGTTRQWYLVTTDSQPDVRPDGDPNHAATASGGAYLEVLPDTRRSHGDKLTAGENFSNDPGKMAILHYKVHINTPGRYYVWARIFSTNSEDNGLHVGIDGEWPESGRRMQWTAKHQWAWGSKQRTAKVHTGVKHKLYLDVAEAGPHTIAFSMREDGTEFDKWMMVREKREAVAGHGPEPRLKSGRMPPPFSVPANTIAASQAAAPTTTAPSATGAGIMPAVAFPRVDTGFYVDRDTWLAINPSERKAASATCPFPFPDSTYHVALHTVGENDGRSVYTVSVGDLALAPFTAPLASTTVAEGKAYVATWDNVAVRKGDLIRVAAATGSEDGAEHSRGRWSRLVFTRTDGKPVAPVRMVAASARATAAVAVTGPPLHGPRQPDGDGSVVVAGELQQWHMITLNVNGPFAHELDLRPNPFTDYCLSVVFRHEAGGRAYDVPGYFAADGDAANTSAESGTAWRVHFRPDRTGAWTYRVSFLRGPGVAVGSKPAGEAVPGLHGKTGGFDVSASDKAAPDLRARGRLEYVGGHYLRFAGTGEFFLKQGADAPENLLAYADFDGAFKTDGIKDDLVKTWEAHVRDWRPGDPSWAGGRGKGLIGALNYLASEEMNAVSMLTLNIDGDDRNVFPYVNCRDVLHLDCSKLDQWEIALEHAEQQGLFLHFKTQETENECLLDGGDTGPQRRLYYRELIARFGHHLALNWNLGEENGTWGRKRNKQTTEQRLAMAAYFRDHDPYHGHIVIHNGQRPDDLLGPESPLTGYSLQTNSPAFVNVHRRTLEWIRKSAEAGKPWVVACDEPGDASHSLVPDADDPDHDEARMNALWGNLLAGGSGCEWYFGYKHAHSDLTCQDWRSRDLWWDQCRTALRFFGDNAIPFWEMVNVNALVGNESNENTVYCFAKPGALYLVYQAPGKQVTLDLTDVSGRFDVRWFDPRTGGGLRPGSTNAVEAGGPVKLGTPPSEHDKDWLAIVKRQ